MARAGFVSRFLKPCAVATCLAVVAACGGGDDGGCHIQLGISNPAVVTTADAFVLSGTASLPAGSERAGGTVFMPIVTCHLGSYDLTWSNAANGTSGRGILVWNCDQSFAYWTGFRIPLAMGVNHVTVTMRDSLCEGQVTATITRN